MDNGADEARGHDERILVRRHGERRPSLVVDDGVGVAAPARWRMGWRTEEAGSSGEVVVAPTVYEWGNGGEGGISNFGTRLSEMWESYELIPRLKFVFSKFELNLVGYIQ